MGHWTHRHQFLDANQSLKTASPKLMFTEKKFFWKHPDSEKSILRTIDKHFRSTLENCFALIFFEE